MSIFSGNFMGFTYDGQHSSSLGIVRTSGGNRFNEELIPPFDDQIVSVPGGDGAYLFGTKYNPKPLNISIAYDSLTELDFHNLRIIFSNQKPTSLILDESPYKVYTVKVANPPILNYICFEKNGERIYKGEGNINFIAYSPLARSRYKFKNDYVSGEDQAPIIDNIPEWENPYSFNFNEWVAASGIIDNTNGTYDLFKPVGDSDNIGKINLWNPGVKEADYKLKIKFLERDEGIFSIPPLTVSLVETIDGTERTVPQKILVFNTILREEPLTEDSDWGVQINTKLNLIEGIKENGDITGNIYNQFHNRGHYFKIPLNKMVDNEFQGSTMKITMSKQANEELSDVEVYIEYNYLYY